MGVATNLVLAVGLLSCLRGINAADAQLKLVDCRQSSTHTPCDRAIDGNTNQDWSGGSCSHTQHEAAPWWQANTPRLAHISQVRIYNRLCGADCSAHLNNFVIKVDGVECASYQSSTFFSVETFTCNRVGQVVEILSRKQTYLMPCEVIAFGTYVVQTTKAAPLPLHDCRQSTTHALDCSKAIDGNTHQHWPGSSCTHTSHEDNPWWQANTKELAHIKQVRIYNRLCGPSCSTYLSNIVVKVDGHVCAKYHSATGYFSTHTFDCDRVGQVVEVRGVGRTYLMLCEIEVFGEYVSLEHKGAPLPLHDCRQSSTHTDCSRAIDGITAQHWPGNSCSHTQLENNPWWQANTKQLARIRQVRIYSRLCGPVCSMHLSNFLVKVDGHVCARYHNPLGYISTHTFNCNRVGQVIEIQAVGTTYLMLCELQVFGEFVTLEHKGDPLPLLDCRQSSTHALDCSKAIDGNTHQHWPGSSCTHTSYEDGPWWQANTKQLAHIQQVRIYNRLCGPNCATHLSNIRVKVDGHVCNSFQHKTEYISTHTFDCDRVGQVVEIQAVGRTYLMLCEVQVFGKYASLAHKGDPLPLLDCRQSSTHALDCNRAIDGNTHQHWPGTSCTHTQLEDGPWWQANTKQLANIQQVRIFNRLCGPACSMHASSILVKVDGHECSSYQSKSEYFSTHTFECNRVGQVVEIQAVGRTYLMLCEVQVFGEYVPLTYKGVPLSLYDCRQSSTHTECSRAIDGNTHQHWPGNSCSHTQLEDNPWWQANLRQLARIKQVRIYARLCGPKCSIHLSNILVKVDGHICSTFQSTTEYISTYTFECDRVGQVIEIEGIGRTYLMLCELQVFGEYVPLANKGTQLAFSECKQSSTHTPCERAMDDNFNQHWPGNSCSHTQMERFPWWQATLVETAYVQQVTIFARLCGPVCSRYMKNLVIKIDGKSCSRQKKTTGYLSTHTFNCNRVGSVVRIEAQATTYLMLCEVQVFGNYGDKPAVPETKTEAPPTEMPICKAPEPPPCIDKHDLSKHNVSTTWVTKVVADGFCYQYSCTGKITDGVPVLTQCMDASGECINPGTKFTCRANENNGTSCMCVRKLASTSVEILS